MRRLALLLSLICAASAFPAELDEIFALADSGDPWRRWQAVERMARLPQDDAIFKLRAALLRDERERVRAAVAWACVLDPTLGNATVLGIALRKDRAATVRRAAARALIHFRDRRAVTALIEALAREEDRRAELAILDTLRALTPAPLLRDPPGWKEWWSRNRKDLRFRPADEPARTAEYEGIVLETRSVAAVRGRGKLRPPLEVLILPQFGWSNEIYGPSLLPLRAHANLTWVRLPTISALTGQSGFGASIPTYPVARLVSSLDRFRSAHGIDRFLVLASGASGWIAMSYAHRFPKRCAGLLLVDTHLDAKAYGDALRRAATRGNRAEKWVAQTLLRSNNVPFNEATLQRMHRTNLVAGFRDPSDLEIGWLYREAREAQGFATVPELKWGRRVRMEMPALFLYSPASAFSGHHEATRIGKHFPRSMVAPLRGSAGSPWIDHNDSFHEVIDHFLRRYDFID